jgi:hypothetical protein
VKLHIKFLPILYWLRAHFLHIDVVKMCFNITVILSCGHAFLVSNVTMELAASLYIFPMKATGSSETSVLIYLVMRH